MKGNKKTILAVLFGQKPERIPVWLMRQAGRYLPEYRALRSKAGSFMKLCLTPELASEVTLQPVRRFGMDGAILFSDILIVPYGLGLKLDFVEGEGPKLEKLSSALPVFKPESFLEKTAPIYGTVRQVASEMPENTTLIGFCGGPWTVACYMLGESKDQFQAARNRDAGFLKELLDVLVEASAVYLLQQIKAGAEVVQIFDSHAGLCPKEFYDDFVMKPAKRIIEKLRAEFPGFPIIGFPRQSPPENLPRYAKETGMTAVSLDTDADFVWAEKNIPAILQGNLDPKLLEGEAEPMLDAAEKILKNAAKPFIFNLGHGLSPQAKPQNVQALVEKIHSWRI